MALNISALDPKMASAVKHFWKSRQRATQLQKQRGTSDQGNRSGVTAGRNMDGFIEMVRQIVIDNGIPDTQIYTTGKGQLTIPGFYRPVKNWDLLVVSRNQLVAAIEFKSQVGPSFGNNFNNRVEEALGNATDLNTAFREGVLGESSKPFLGYFFVLEGCEKSLRPVHFNSPHFPALAEFTDASYAERYEILCRKLVHEQLYDAAALIIASKDSAQSGTYQVLSDLTSPRRFALTLAGRIASMAAEAD